MGWKKGALFIYFLVLLMIVVSGLSQPAASGDSEFTTYLTVRVIQKNQFVRNLGASDFEIIEDGQTRKIESIYLVENKKVTPIHEETPLSPDLNRNYFIIVQSSDYDKKLGEAVNLLVHNYFQPGDSLTLITPVKIYRFNPETLRAKTPAEVSRELQNIMRTDILNGNREYNSVLRDLKRITRLLATYGGETLGADPDVENESDAISSSFGIEYILARYYESLIKLDGLRLADQEKFKSFADSLKRTSGEKAVIFFYQRDFRPELTPRALNQMMSMYQDYPNIIQMLMDLFQFYNRKPSLDKNALSQVLSDSGAVFNFVYLDRKPPRISGVVMNEQSEDIYEALNEAARATGGITDNTFNPVEGLRKSAENLSTYYLIAYRSDQLFRGSRFRKIQVKIKTGGEFQIRHRAGYFIN